MPPMASLGFLPLASHKHSASQRRCFTAFRLFDVRSGENKCRLWRRLFSVLATNEKSPQKADYYNRKSSYCSIFAQVGTFPMGVAVASQILCISTTLNKRE